MNETLYAPVRLVTEARADTNYEAGAFGGGDLVDLDRARRGTSGAPGAVRQRLHTAPRTGCGQRPPVATDVIDAVRTAPLFEALDDRTAADLRGCLTEVRLRRGQVLFREGEVGDRLYVIGAGKIKLGCTSGDGRANMLSLLGPGEEFGELSLFDPGPRSVTATAVTEARVHALSNKDLRPWLQQRPEVGLALLRQLSRRLRRSTEVRGDLMFHDTPGRVAKVLLDLSSRFGTVAEDGLRVTHDLTQEELAQLVGASRETINKVLADFACRGWLRPAARAVTLLDVERLQRRAH
jgi:CRP-like cAMP-binding protein